MTVTGWSMPMYIYAGATPASLAPSAVAATENTSNPPTVTAVEPVVAVPVAPVQPCGDWIWIALIAALVAGASRGRKK